MASSVSGQKEPKSCAVTGYPSPQDGTVFPTPDYPLCPANKIMPKATK